MSQRLNLSKKVELNHVIRDIQLSGKSIEVFEQEQIVAKIVPVSSQVSEYVSSYKTWGETLKNY